MGQTEKLIIDMRQANKHELHALAKLLLNLSVVFSSQNLQIRVTKKPTCSSLSSFRK